MKHHHIKLLSVFTCMALFVTFFALAPANALTGSGTELSPYQVTSCADLEDVNNDLDAYYILTTSIDCTSSGNDIIIGKPDRFEGHFDGDDKTITLGINVNDAEKTALFSETYESEIKDLTVAGSVEGTNVVGGLIADATHTNLTNVHSTATVSGNGAVGGLLGLLFGGTITDSSATGTVNGAEDAVGGLVGTTTFGEFISSFAENNVSGIDGVGGFAGDTSAATFEDSYASGEVEGEAAIGGFAGRDTSSEYTNSYATGDVDGLNQVGGFIGQGDAVSRFTDSYATGDVTNNAPGDDDTYQDTGGFAGELDVAIITHCYSTGLVTSDAYDTGGFAGDLDATTVTESYSTGNVIGGPYSGGFVGDTDEGDSLPGSYDQSYSTGDVSGTERVGGFIGDLQDTPITNSYSRGSVTGDSEVGAFAGRVSNDGSVENTYATGDVTGGTGYIGDESDENSEISYSFYDKNTTGITSSDFGIGKTTSQMKSLDTFTLDLGANAWDFAEIWGIDPDINNGYPQFQWENDYDYPYIDSDGDGVIDSVENAGPNDGDANDNGTLDSQEQGVATFVGVDGKYISVVTTNCDLTQASGMEEPTTNKDVAFDYANGLINWTCETPSAGANTNVTLYIFDIENTGFALRKYNSTSGAYTTISDATLSATTIGGKFVVKATYTATDGGAYDQDETANSTIVDPVGLGYLVVGAPRTGGGGTAQ